LTERHAWPAGAPEPLAIVRRPLAVPLAIVPRPLVVLAVLPAPRPLAMLVAALLDAFRRMGDGAFGNFGHKRGDSGRQRQRGQDAQ
jgi:hypothetical protein